MSTSVSEQDVLSAIAALVQIWPTREMSAEACRLYWVSVRHLSREQFVKGVETAVKTCKYFPTPAEILEFAPTVSETQPWTIEGDIRRTLPEPPLHPQVRELIDGLIATHRMQPSSRDMGNAEAKAAEHPQSDTWMHSTPEEIEAQETQRAINISWLMMMAMDKKEITREQYEEFKEKRVVPKGKYEDSMSSGDVEFWQRIADIESKRISVLGY